MKVIRKSSLVNVYIHQTIHAMFLNGFEEALNSNIIIFFIFFSRFIECNNI